MILTNLRDSRGRDVSESAVVRSQTVTPGSTTGTPALYECLLPGAGADLPGHPTSLKLTSTRG